MTSRDMREVILDVPSLEPIVHEGPGEQVARERDQPAGQVSPPRQEVEVRRSNRVNKGETTKFKD